MEMNQPVDNENDLDEIELTLRRYASKKSDEALTKLLDSLFTNPVGDSNNETDGDTEDGEN